MFLVSAFMFTLLMYLLFLEWCSMQLMRNITLSVSQGQQSWISNLYFSKWKLIFRRTVVFRLSFQYFVMQHKNILCKLYRTFYPDFWKTVTLLVRKRDLYSQAHRLNIWVKECFQKTVIHILICLQRACNMSFIFLLYRLKESILVCDLLYLVMIE